MTLSVKIDILNKTFIATDISTYTRSWIHTFIVYQKVIVNKTVLGNRMVVENKTITAYKKVITNITSFYTATLTKNDVNCKDRHSQLDIYCNTHWSIQMGR